MAEVVDSGAEGLTTLEVADLAASTAFEVVDAILGRGFRQVEDYRGLKLCTKTVPSLRSAFFSSVAVLAYILPLEYLIVIVYAPRDCCELRPR